LFQGFQNDEVVRKLSVAAKLTHLLKLKEPGLQTRLFQFSRRRREITLRMQLYHVPAEHAGRLPYVNLTIKRRFYEIFLISIFSAILTGSMQLFMKNEKSDPF
jgi:hypothetical protein